MPEFVIVKYHRKRNVYANNMKVGQTNKTFMMGRGTHRFDLGKPRNYSPASRTVRLGRTRRSKPKVLKFTYKGGNLT